MKNKPRSPILLDGQKFTPCAFCLVVCFLLLTTVCHQRCVAYGMPTFATTPAVITETASSVTNNSVTLHGIVNANGLSTTAWFQYRIVNGPSQNTASTQTVIGSNDTEVTMKVIELLPGTTYFYRIVVKNDTDIAYGNELSFTTTGIQTYVPSDITPPSGSIRIGKGSSCTNSLAITVSLTATDNMGVAAYYLSTNPSPPSPHTTGWTSTTPVGNYKEDVSYILSDGDGRNTVYVWYKDSSGNISDAASDSILVDTTPPAITITHPTSGSPYTSANKTINISGIATDAMNEVKSVVLSNSKEGKERERKTVDWTLSNIDLQEGDNVITIMATDSVGNTGKASMTITYTGSNNPPVVITGPATAITTNLATLTGTVNPKGLSATAWFQYDTNIGSYRDKTSTQNIEDSSSDTRIRYRLDGLQAGVTYYYRLVVQNSTGVIYGNEAAFKTKPPKGKIHGYIEYVIGNKPIELARIQLKGTKSRKRSFKVIFSDAQGAFKCNDLDTDTYDISVTKTGYQNAGQTVELKEGERKKVEINVRRIKGEDRGKSSP